MDLSENGWWVAVPADVVRCPGLSVRARLMHVILMSYRDPKKPQEEVYPRVDTLARMLDCCEKSIGRAMKELEGAKLIERKRRMGRSTLTALKATGYVLPTRLPCPVAPDTHDPAEEEPVKKNHTTSADKPQEEAVTETKQPHDYTIVPAEEEVPHRPLARPKKPQNPRYVAQGAVAVNLYTRYIASPGLAPPVAEQSAATLAKAGKTVHALKDSRFAGKTLAELMPLLVERIKTCEPVVRKAINFNWLFWANAPNLARLLNGDWDTEAGQEPEKPRLREVPLEDVTPGESAKDYWARKDKEAGDAVQGA